MKNKQIKILALTLLLVLALTACRARDNNIGNNNNRRLSTQTRIEDDRRNTGTDIMDDRWNTGNNMLSEDMVDPLANDGIDNNLNDGMTRPNPNLSTNIGNSQNEVTGLSRKISDLNEVDEAKVVISGDTALVGVSLRGNKQDTMINALRDKIENIVKKSNNNIKKVSITTKPDLFKRIGTISRDVEMGNPIKDLAEEIKDILRAISPDTNVNR